MVRQRYLQTPVSQPVSVKIESKEGILLNKWTYLSAGLHQTEWNFMKHRD